MRAIGIISLLLLLPFFGNAQNSAKKEQKIALKAQKFFDDFNYKKVVEYADDLAKGSIQSQRNLANSYWKLGDLANAERTYSRLLDLSERSSKDILNYALLLRRIGEYEESIEWMTTYAQLNKNDDFVNAHLEDPKAHEFLLDSNRYFDLIHLRFNSAYQDLAAVYYGEAVVFVSSREAFKPIVRRYAGNGMPFLNLFRAITYDSTFNLIYPRTFAKELNGKKHDGPATFSKDRLEIIFTANSSSKNADGTYPLQLFHSKKSGKSWSTPELLSINDSVASSCHPSLSADGNYLYFASDRAGGKGGFDVYRVKKTENGWGTPQNLGETVNTSKDDVFPFIHESGEIMTYASNGKVGLGGLDIFVGAVNMDQTIGRVFNLGSPINSSGNDFAFIFNEEQSRGYLTSDRDGGKGREDIYGVAIKRPIVLLKVILGTILDEKGQPASAVKVSLKDDTGTVIETVSTNEAGQFRFQLDEEKGYQIEAENSLYRTENRKIDPVSESGEMRIQFQMKRR